MTGALTLITPKLAKLLPRLASDHDGEVVATARAISRTLASAGFDFHDLAGALDRSEPSPRMAYRGRRQAPSPEPDHAEVAIARCLVRFLLDLRPHAITPKENAFLRSLLGSLDDGRRPSPKQFGWLRDIHARAVVETRS